MQQLQETFSYDPETGFIYNQKTERKVGYLKNGYVYVAFGKLNLPAHRLVWALHYGYEVSEVDHIDRDKTNNRIENLRVATRSQNTANTGARGAIRAKGVSWCKQSSKYRAQLKVNGKLKIVGSFKTVDEAAHAYNKEAIKQHGEFACLNPIGQDKESA